MLSAKEWWGIIGTYGAQIWPAQLVFFIIAITLVVWLSIPGDASTGQLLRGH